MLARLARAVCLAAVFAAPAGAAELTRIPARVQGHDVYLQVRLDGGAPVWMKFDVGADHSSLAAAAQRPASISVGGVALAPVRFGAAAPTAPGPDGAPLAGHLGEDSLGDRVLVIRYAARAVYLSPPIDTASVPLPPLERAPATRTADAAR